MEKSHLLITSHFVRVDTILDYATLWWNQHNSQLHHTLKESLQWFIMAHPVSETYVIYIELSFLIHFDGIDTIVVSETL